MFLEACFSFVTLFSSKRCDWKTWESFHAKEAAVAALALYIIIV
jgi:hypothetical protein